QIGDVGVDDGHLDPGARAGATGAISHGDHALHRLVRHRGVVARLRVDQGDVGVTAITADRFARAVAANEGEAGEVGIATHHHVPGTGAYGRDVAHLV